MLIESIWLLHEYARVSGIIKVKSDFSNGKLASLVASTHLNYKRGELILIYTYT